MLEIIRVNKQISISILLTYITKSHVNKRTDVRFPYTAALCSRFFKEATKDCDVEKLEMPLPAHKHLTPKAQASLHYNL